MCEKRAARVLEASSFLEAEFDSKGHVLFYRVLEDETEIVRNNVRKLLEMIVWKK